MHHSTLKSRFLFSVLLSSQGNNFGASQNYLGYPNLGSSDGKKNNICLQCRRPRFNPWVGKISWRREWPPTPVFLCREFHGETTGSQRVRHNLATNTTHDGATVSIRLQCGRCRLDPWVEKTPWRRKWKPIPVFLHGKSHGQRRLAGCSPWGRKSQTWLVTRPRPPKKHKLLSYM